MINASFVRKIFPVNFTVKQFKGLIKDLKIKPRQLNTSSPSTIIYNALNANKIFQKKYPVISKDIKLVLEKNIKLTSFFDNVKDKMRQFRKIHDEGYVIIQNPIVPIVENETLIDDLLLIPEVVYINDNIKTFVKLASDIIKKDANSKIIFMKVQIMRYYESNLLVDINPKKPELGTTQLVTSTIAYDYEMKDTKVPDVDKYLEDESESNKGVQESSNFRYIRVGFRIFYATQTKKRNDKTIYDIKAYSPSQDMSFHNATLVSTSLDKICIYESYLHITGVRNLKFKHKIINSQKVNKLLENEGEEINKSIRNGELVKSLELLTLKYNTEILIMFHDSPLYKQDNINKLKGSNYPISIKNGITIVINDDNLQNLKQNDICMLYSKGHVAPALIKIKSEKETQKLIDLHDFILTPKFRNTYGDKPIGIMGFDFETFNGERNWAHPYCGTIVGEYDKKKIKKDFYSATTVTDFVDYLDTFTIKTSCKKSKNYKKVPYTIIYGFNNSRFDNLLIYKELFNRNPDTETTFVGTSIKCIKYWNILIFDIACQYKLGSLRETAKAFELEKEKGVFPYRFTKSDNLHYIGKVPELKYWNNINDFEEYCKNYSTNYIPFLEDWISPIEYEKICQETTMFNMKEYTIKYCFLDSELVYEMAKLHINNCIGELDGRLFNVIKCPTSANLSLHLYNEVFQNEKFVQSPDEIIIKEKLGYKGGRTEVFKRFFCSKSHKRLYYIDINSAHPSGMTKLMPYKYLETIKTDPFIINLNDIEDYHLYLVSSIYKGNDKQFIPNLLQRADNNIIATKNTTQSYHWGIEIKEAILNNCEITCFEINRYEGKAVFKVFAEYYYKERLAIKKKNIVLALFYKNVLNSLYGKFGQKPHNEHDMCKNMEEVLEIVGDKHSSLIDINILEDGTLFIEYQSLNQDCHNIGKLVRFSSYIAATTRCKLSEVMRDIGHEHIYYCDTDSIFTDKMPSNKYLDNNILGAWKDELGGEDYIDNAIFIAPKVYFYHKAKKNEYIKAAKGFNSDKIDVNDYNKMLKDKNYAVIQSNLMFMRSLEGVRIINQERTLVPVLNKRIWIDDSTSEAFETITHWQYK